jgi:hypothetical protein
LIELAGLEGIPASDCFLSSQEEADEELSAILDRYNGPLPTTRARDRFHKNRDALNFVRENTGHWLEVPFPPRLTLETGLFGWAVSTRHLLGLLAADREARNEEWADFLKRLAGFFEMGGDPLQVEDQSANYDRVLATYLEMIALTVAMPDMPSQHGRSHIEWCLNMVIEERHGSMFQRNLFVVYPDSCKPYHRQPSEGMSVPVGRAMALVAKDTDSIDPSASAELRKVIKAYYLPDDLHLDITLHNGRAIHLDEVTSTKAMGFEPETGPLLRIPGSVAISSDFESLSYSPSDDDLEFKIFSYVAHDDQYGDESEFCLLVSPELTLRSYLYDAE